MSPFLGEKSRGAFKEPAFFLAGNCITIVTCEKGFFLKLKLISQNDCSIVSKF